MGFSTFFEKIEFLLSLYTLTTVILIKMKLPALISTLLCIALYAVQVVVPCSSCAVETCVPSECSGCANHDGAPGEEPDECSCDIEFPSVSWDNGKSDSKNEQKLVAIQTNFDRPSFSFLHRQVVTTLALPPPRQVNAQAMYCLFLI